MLKKTVLFMLVLLCFGFSAFAAEKDVFPNGFDPLAATQTEHQNAVELNLGALIGNMLAVEYENLLFGDNISLVLQGLFTFINNGFGLGGGAGGRYHLAPTIDGLYGGGAARVYTYKYDEQIAGFEYQYRYVTVIPYGELGYRISLWDKMTINAALQLGMRFEWFGSRLESESDSISLDDNSQSLYGGLAFNIGLSF